MEAVEAAGSAKRLDGRGWERAGGPDWNASSGATSYNVGRSTISGGPYSTQACAVLRLRAPTRPWPTGPLLLRCFGDELERD